MWADVPRRYEGAMRSPHLDSFGGHQDFEQVVQVVHLLHEHGGLGHDRDAHDLRLAALHGRSRQTLERLEQAEPEVAIANLRQQVGDRQAPGLQVGVPPALKGDELGGGVVLFGSRHRGERGGSKNEGCRRCWEGVRQNFPFWVTACKSRQSYSRAPDWTVPTSHSCRAIL